MKNKDIEAKRLRNSVKGPESPTLGEIENCLTHLNWRKNDEEIKLAVFRAVNSHEALLKAAKDVLKGCRKSLFFNPKFLRPLEEAIAKAEGK